MTEMPSTSTTLPSASVCLHASALVPSMLAEEVSIISAAGNGTLVVKACQHNETSNCPPRARVVQLVFEFQFARFLARVSAVVVPGADTVCCAQSLLSEGPGARVC
jgi:hypothetical protein